MGEENEEDEGDEDEDDDEDDDDAGSDAYDDDQDEFHDLEDAFFRMPGGATGAADREHDPVMMIGHVNDDPLIDDRAIQLPLWGEMNMAEGGGVVDNMTNAGGAGTSGVAPSHPLLMGRSAEPVAAGSARGQGRSLTRQRGFRYIQLPRNGAGAPGTPAILQSLLGHSNRGDFLQLSTNPGGINMGGIRDSTRLLVMDQGFAILDSMEEGGMEGIEGGILGQTGGSALSTVPNALVRWTEESRVLDGDSLHDCMTVCKPDVLEIIEKYRDEELAERKEKRKKLQEEE